MRAPAVALAFALALAAGCLRVGPGEDLHLVCEEKSLSPRKAYGIELLVAQTRVEGDVSDERRLALLETARGHLVTMGGRMHAGFHATLVPAGAGEWRFDAVGEREGAEPDVYQAYVRADENGTRSRAGQFDGHWSTGPVLPPRSIYEPAWRTANASLDLDAEPLLWPAWDPELPSCVSLNLGGTMVMVNVVQGRVVHVAS